MVAIEDVTSDSVVGRSRGRISMRADPTSAYRSVPSPGGQSPSKLIVSLIVSKGMSGRR